MELGTKRMNRQEPAETLALRALGWMLGQDEVLGAFMAASGSGSQDLAAGARDPVFLGAVLEFLLTDDAWVIAFCDAENLPYGAPMQARQTLPGGEAVHWT